MASNCVERRCQRTKTPRSKNRGRCHPGRAAGRHPTPPDPSDTTAAGRFRAQAAAIACSRCRSSCLQQRATDAVADQGQGVRLAFVQAPVAWRIGSAKAKGESRGGRVAGHPLRASGRGQAECVGAGVGVGAADSASQPFGGNAGGQREQLPALNSGVNLDQRAQGELLAQQRAADEVHRLALALLS